MQRAVERGIRADGRRPHYPSASDIVEPAENQRDWKSEDCGDKYVSQWPAYYAGIDSQIDVASVEGRVQDSALKKVGDIVSNHPDEAASIVRGWLYSD